MPKMLRHVETGEIWPYNTNLARHDKVEVFDQPDPQFAAAAADDGATVGDLVQAEVVAPEKSKKRKPKPEPAPAEPAPEADEDVDPLEGLDLPDDV